MTDANPVCMDEDPVLLIHFSFVSSVFKIKSCNLRSFRYHRVILKHCSRRWKGLGHVVLKHHNTTHTFS